MKEGRFNNILVSFMINDLWQDCINCKTKDCCRAIAFPLFTTPKERENNPEINSQNPCVFFNDCGLCEIHDQRPFDCRFFPFDLMKIDKKFFWVIWNIDCSITKNRRGDFEKYLAEHEEKLLPNFIDHIKEYADFRVEELKQKYEYELLREIRIKLF